VTTYRVHPNSPAARKWRLTHWTTRQLYAHAAQLDKHGRHEAATAVRRVAVSHSRTTLACG
jgi:hypothetical protein